MSAHQEIKRRRTFAIISHPDAGKTTLTEKFLLYGGAVQLAGAVKTKKNQRATTSDWMALERQRGISVSSTVLQFEYGGFAVNLLDTPGHKDFSEDTYRVLTAVDAALMVIDAAKGIEPQTKKLFEVCRHRGIPIFTFMNKCDRPTREPLALLDELEAELGLRPTAVAWPLGNGPTFRAVYDRHAGEVHLFEKVPGGAFRAPERVGGLDDAIIRDRLPSEDLERAREELEMLELVGEAFDREAVLAGEQTPVFFGSAVNNFGVQLLLDKFLGWSAEPAPRRSKGEPVPVDAPTFSGFIFKIQANMDPKHRDRIAFMRVCSGVFERDMWVVNTRTGRKHRLSSSQKLFGRDRETVDKAWPGDIIGLIGHDEFAIGDTLAESAEIRYEEMPRFPPECFSYISNVNKSADKKFRAGLTQLLKEGVVQALTLKHAVSPVPVLAAVGPLQFDVFKYRLESEYGAEVRMEPAPWTAIRWLDFGGREPDFDSLVLPAGVSLAFDSHEDPVLLFPNDWLVKFFDEKNEGVQLHALPPDLESAPVVAL
ncbi:MAG: peptide chain release factor 3 [Verrucomicrobia bacterium]|nr:MAG: peptide chain release factor 3 [Verrucomicrobiota bacterium]